MPQTEWRGNFWRIEARASEHLQEASLSIRLRYSNAEVSQIASLGPDIVQGTLTGDGLEATFLQAMSEKYKIADEVECTLRLQDLAGWENSVSLAKWKIPKTQAIQVPPESKPALQLPIKLRSTPDENLTEEEVRDMIKKYDFYCANVQGLSLSNPNGKGLANDFVSQQNGQVILDRASDLMWQQGGSIDYMTFEEGQEYIKELNRQKFAGYSDWRLPTLEEAMSLMEPVQNRDLYIDAKFYVKQRRNWTSDFYDAKQVWYVNFVIGLCELTDLNYGYFVRAVRSGQ